MSVIVISFRFESLLSIGRHWNDLWSVILVFCNLYGHIPVSLKVRFTKNWFSVNNHRKWVHKVSFTEIAIFFVPIHKTFWVRRRASKIARAFLESVGGLFFPWMILVNTSLLPKIFGESDFLWNWYMTTFICDNAHHNHDVHTTVLWTHVNPDLLLALHFNIWQHWTSLISILNYPSDRV